MCCYADEAAKKKVLAAFGKRKTMIMWKGLQTQAKSYFGFDASGHGGYQYHPGVHKERVSKYRIRQPRGFHVYLFKPQDYGVYSYLYVVPVVVHKDDIIRVGFSSPYTFLDRPVQVVVRQLTIRQKAWDKAKCPPMKRSGGKWVHVKRSKK